MKVLTLFIAVSILSSSLYGQRLKVSGRLSCQNSPVPDALILVFENGKFYKKLISDHGGQFGFSGRDQKYLMLFYKPGMEPESFTLINHMDRASYIDTESAKVTWILPIYLPDRDVQRVMINMHPAHGSTDSIIIRSRLLTDIKPELAQKYISSVYDYSSRPRHGADSTARKMRDNSIVQAISERDRFANYKRDSTVDTQKNGVLTTIVGPDTYELQTNATGQKHYLKNNKPITETTYRFETTRRYEGVLKNTRDVKRFERYHPIEHVK